MCVSSFSRVFSCSPAPICACYIERVLANFLLHRNYAAAAFYTCTQVLTMFKPILLDFWHTLLRNYIILLYEAIFKYPFYSPFRVVIYIAALFLSLSGWIIYFNILHNAYSVAKDADLYNVTVLLRTAARSSQLIDERSAKKIMKSAQNHRVGGCSSPFLFAACVSHGIQGRGWRKKQLENSLSTRPYLRLC